MANYNKPALLVAVNISHWVGRKSDKTANSTVANAHGVESGAGNYSKKLLPDAIELQNVKTLVGQIREFVYLETLPWMADGTRILSSKNYLDFVTKFRGLKSQFEMAVNEFIRMYPALKTDAQNKLGGLYNESDYPAVSQLQDSFNCEINLFPMPDASDFRLEIGDAEKQAFEDKIKATQAKAIEDCHKRLFDVIKSAADTLANPKAIFRDSLISNITEICDLLPKLNFNDDAELEAKRVEAKALAKNLKPDNLRANATDRQDAAAELRAMQSRMTAIMKGNN